MARFQGAKQAFKVSNQVDLRRIALRRNNLTWIDHATPAATTKSCNVGIHLGIGSFDCRLLLGKVQQELFPLFAQG
jgi:hypothetical protein